MVVWYRHACCCFNTQPPEGGWQPVPPIRIKRPVSTHSRPKAAGVSGSTGFSALPVSTHSRPKAAGAISRNNLLIYLSFNTQPPEGGWCSLFLKKNYISSFNTQPPEGGWDSSHTVTLQAILFQHTVARRRLGHGVGR